MAGMRALLRKSGEQVVLLERDEVGAAWKTRYDRAREVLLAVRTPPSIVRRDTLGVPSQLLGIATGHLPVGAVDRIASTMRRVAIPDLAPYGLSAPPRPYSDFLRRGVLPILGVGIVDAVRKGRVRVVGAVEGFADEAVALAKGRLVEVDAVIAATGFRTGLEPLLGHLGVPDDKAFRSSTARTSTPMPPVSTSSATARRSPGC